jgi:hypothetical protein
VPQAELDDDPRLAALVADLHGLRMAGVFELAADGSTLERVAAVGPTEARIYGRFPLGSRLPVADVFYDGQTRYLEQPDDWSAYPLSLRLQIEVRGWPAVAVVPIDEADHRIGVLYLVFEPETALRDGHALFEAAARGWLAVR